MKVVAKWALTLASLAVLVVLQGETEVRAQSSYFANQCAGCHSGATANTACNACHAHGVHGSSAKNTINLTATPNKTTYAAGETVTVSITGGYRSGWARFVLYDQNGTELVRSVGNASGKGNAVVYSSSSAATLSAPAPNVPGTYTWKAAWYGNIVDSNGAAFGSSWTPDAGNSGHGSEYVNITTFTVTAPGDTTAPAVDVFTLPATANSLTVDVTSFTASDATGVTGYLVTTTSATPAASAPGWSASAPTTVTAPSGGSVTFYAWAKDAAGNVSASRNATVNITVPDTTAPVVTVFALPPTSASTTVNVTTFTATDAVGVTGYLITTTSTPPNASDTGWSGSAPGSVTAPGDGTFTFYAWAKDAAGNVSASVSDTVVVNTTVPAGPVLAISTLDNGSYTKVRTLNVTGTVTDPDGVALLTINRKKVAVGNGGAFTGAVQLRSGNNTITIVATDSLGNVTTDKRTIIYDPKAPTLTIVGPADNLKTDESIVTFTGKTNEDDTVVTFTVNGGEVQYAQMSGRNFTAVANLTEGTNTIQLTATDLAGNSSTRKRTVVYDHTKPTLEITEPSQDLTTDSRNLLIKGQVSDSLPVKVTIAVNGKSSSVGVKKGAFQKRITLSGAGTYSVTVTATDAVGNTSEVTRTIIYSLPETDHPFGWTNPRSSHRGYVEKNGTAECIGCHSTDRASKGQPMSCYNCHGKKW